MRFPSPERFAYLSKSFAILICGMIIGAAIFMSVTHHHLEYFITENRSLNAELNKLIEDNEDLHIYKNRQTVIKSVSVGVEQDSGEEPLSEIIVSEIKQRVEEDLKGIKGQPISYIDQSPQNIKNIYGQKLLAGIHDKDYVVEIHTIVVIYGELKVWITAREFTRGAP